MDEYSPLTRRLIADGLKPKAAPAAPVATGDDPLSIALRALDEIANPAYGLGFRGLKQIAKRGLREVRAAMPREDAA